MSRYALAHSFAHKQMFLNEILHPFISTNFKHPLIYKRFCPFSASLSLIIYPRVPLRLPWDTCLLGLQPAIGEAKTSVYALAELVNKLTS